MRNIIILGLLMMLSVGCEQNPLADYGQGVREAEDPSNKVYEPLDPISRDALFVEESSGSSRLNFVEGEEGSVEFSGRVSHIRKGKDGLPIVDADGNPVKIPFRLLVEVLPSNGDGSASEFKEEKGSYKLIWTPPNTYVRGQNQSRKKQIKVVLETTASPILRREFIFNLVVNRDIVRPKIASIGGVPAKMNEGGTLNFTVHVFDSDSFKGVFNEKDEERAPKLIFVPMATGRRDLSSYLQLLSVNPKEDIDEQGLWKFSLRLDTSDQELVRGVDIFSFGIVAVSRFGVRSLVRKAEIRIINRVSVPVVTWDEDLTVKVGEHVIYNFDVFSPKSVVDSSAGSNVTIDEKVSVKEFSCGTALQPNCTCKTLNHAFRRIHCTIDIQPTAAEVGSHSAKIVALSENPYDRSDVNPVVVHRTINVLPMTVPNDGSKMKGEQ